MCSKNQFVVVKYGKTVHNVCTQAGVNIIRFVFAASGTVPRPVGEVADNLININANCTGSKVRLIHIISIEWTSLKGGCTIFGKLICFQRHLGFLRAIYQVLIKALIRIFKSQKYFWIYEHSNISRFKSVYQFLHGPKIQQHMFNNFNFINHDK